MRKLYKGSIFLDTFMVLDVLMAISFFFPVPRTRNGNNIHTVNLVLLKSNLWQSMKKRDCLHKNHQVVLNVGNKIVPDILVYIL